MQICYKDRQTGMRTHTNHAEKMYRGDNRKKGERENLAFLRNQCPNQALEINVNLDLLVSESTKQE